MKTAIHQSNRRGAAFTLVEMLVVIAIIGILAALIFPAFSAVDARAKRNKARGELKQIESAIESYYARYNHYPPDNTSYPLADPRRFAVNQLLYELLGTISTNGVYTTLDGREQIPAASLNAAFGSAVSGFVNTTRPGGDDAVAAAAKNFLPGLAPSRFGIANNGVRYGLLTCSVPWPKDLGPVANGAGFANDLNPVRYNSSAPTHNKKTYDLWVDIVIKGRTNRISNWNPSYELVN